MLMLCGHDPLHMPPAHVDKLTQVQKVTGTWSFLRSRTFYDSQRLQQKSYPFIQNSPNPCLDTYHQTLIYTLYPFQQTDRQHRLWGILSWNPGSLVALNTLNVF